MARKKNPLVAGILNFVVPGLGLFYVGRRRAAAINFALVNFALIVFTVFYGEPTLMEHVHYLFLGLAALSAGYAHGVATTLEHEIENMKNGLSSP